jgi:hypothetical protein
MLLHAEEEPLDPLLEAPEGSPAQKRVPTGPALQQLEEADGVEGSVVAAEVARALLVDLRVVDLVGGVVGVRDEGGQGTVRDGEGLAADVGQRALQDVVPELAYLPRHNGYLHFPHFCDYIDDFGLDVS